MFDEYDIFPIVFALSVIGEIMTFKSLVYIFGII